MVESSEVPRIPPLSRAVLSLAVSTAVFLFGSLTLIAPSGYSWGPALLLALSIIGYAKSRCPIDFRKDYIPIAVAFALFFLLALCNIFIHDLDLRTLDRPSRFLFAILVFPILVQYPPRPSFLWSGMAVGAILAGLWASKQVLIDGISRAHGNTHIIQFGNIAILLGFLNLAGFFWAIRQRKNFQVLKILSILGVIGGIAASILSGSRGGWVSFPIMTFICLYFLAPSLTKAQILVVIAAIGLIITALLVIKGTGVAHRSQQAVTEVRDYLSTGQANTSTGARLEMWKAAIILGSRRPIIGWGEKEVEDQKKRLVKEEGLDPYILKFSHAHNDFLDNWQKRGAFGLIVFTLLYGIPLIMFIRKFLIIRSEEKSLALAGIIICASYICFSLTQAFFEHNSGATVYAFAVTIFWALITKTDLPHQK
ncbi:O-antigen ligase family protein [Marinimicrobium sp. ARAG 43.8]|uniref:O-antigen ligase family protein n=1 Tax=Marinimicrobium sp. ARAG 43.8 TaxID=3418719 RepID=UPI003CEE6FAB